jgi:hypothetical protein
MVIQGYMNGTSWNKDTRKFDIKKLGTSDNGAILCGLSVNGKDKDSNKVYGKPVDIKIQIKSSDEGKRVYGLISSGADMLQAEGFFVPNNYNDKEGKEVKGNQFLVLDSSTVQVAKKASSKQSAPTEEESNPWS